MSSSWAISSPCLTSCPSCTFSDCSSPPRRNDSCASSGALRRPGNSRMRSAPGSVTVKSFTGRGFSATGSAGSEQPDSKVVRAMAERPVAIQRAARSMGNLRSSWQKRGQKECTHYKGLGRATAANNLQIAPFSRLLWPATPRRRADACSCPAFNLFFYILY